MNTLNERVIELSKTKVTLLISGAFAFVALGIWLFSMDSAYIASQRRLNSPFLVHTIGLISIVFFGLCGVFGVAKMFDKRPGLVLNEAGIIDNSSGVSAGLIPWTDIVDFDVFQLQKQKMLIVKVSNPEKYIAVGGAMKRSLNKFNFKLCGSPIAINSNTLKISFDELLDICNRYFDKFGKNT